jgi:hypothetical protein
MVRVLSLDDSVLLTSERGCQRVGFVSSFLGRLLYRQSHLKTTVQNNKKKSKNFHKIFHKI